MNPKKRKDKSLPRLVYSTDKQAIVKQARAAGLPTGKILSALVSGEYGVQAKLKIVREWAPSLGLSEDEAMLEAKKAGILK
ncbi:MAG TPA: hypothetical protein VEU33_34825 [Archangium sp.]|nr:hypothetical protein [Archangium sp.]